MQQKHSVSSSYHVIINPSWIKIKWIKLKPFPTQGSDFKGESTQVFSVFKIFHNFVQQTADNILKGYPKFVF